MSMVGLEELDTLSINVQYRPLAFSLADVLDCLDRSAIVVAAKSSML